MTEVAWAPSGVVALLTDFGLADNYVGQMKGVMLGISRQLALIDLTHLIPAQDVLEGAFQLVTAWDALSPGTVFLAVVDPGVGTSRRAVAFALGVRAFVGPDNGLASLVLDRGDPDWCLRLDPQTINPAASATFHGRDVFAPVAARLATSTRLDGFGSALDPSTLVRLPVPAVGRTDVSASGPVVSVDHFGNCRTLITRQDLPAEAARCVVRCGPLRLAGISRTYGDVARGAPVAYFGSHGGLEIAVHNGSAAAEWRIQRGALVEVRAEASSP